MEESAGGREESHAGGPAAHVFTHQQPRFLGTNTGDKMNRYDFTSELSQNGITIASDGLLRDLLSRGVLGPSLAVIDASVAKREKEIRYLRALQVDLVNDITKETAVTPSP